MRSSAPLTADQLTAAYTERHREALEPIADALRDHVAALFEGEPRIDRITARAKGVESFVEKAVKVTDGRRKYEEPFAQIQDQIGVRIVTFYAADIERVSDIIRRYFKPIEIKNHVPESPWRFGYFGTHFILLLPQDVIDERLDRELVPTFFELQIKTLFQHAWSEAEHDLGYKPGDEPLSDDEVRRLAFTSAQAWGADHIFNELYLERNPPKAAT